MKFFRLHAPTTEEDLISKCKIGDPIAQREIYGKYAPKLWPLCLRYMKNREEAEDVLSQAFVKVFQKINQYKNEGSFEGWIRTIVVREALMALRKRSIQWVDIDVVTHREIEPSWVDDGDIEVEYLMQLIQKLPEGYKTIFNLYAIEGYKHSEIAKMLDISENTSKTQLMRARNLLVKELENLKKKEIKSLSCH